MISFKTGALSRSIYKSGKWQLCQMPNILSKCSSSQKLTSNCILASSSFHPASISSSCAHREESEDGGSGWEVSVFREACLQLCVRFDLIRSSKHEGQERRSGRLGPEPTSECSESMLLQHTEKSSCFKHKHFSSIRDSAASLEPEVKIKGSGKDFKGSIQKPGRAAHPPL